MSTSQAKQTSKTTVFMGGASGMSGLLQPGIETSLIDSSTIGLYGHLNGIFDLLQQGDLAAVLAEFTDSAPGVAEFGASLGYATGMVDLINNTSTTQALYVGTDLQSSSGLMFAVTNNFHAAPIGYDSKLGEYYYVLAAGSSYDIPIEASELGI